LVTPWEFPRFVNGDSASVPIEPRKPVSKKSTLFMQFKVVPRSVKVIANA
jgi:hypothetical protein